ncbi:MAG TPA: GH1 family beta-glucosidase [Chloroflexia bacterium]|nr:GH1 family beta-glucosidase [Chloroflexia bacterium]
MPDERNQELRRGAFPPDFFWGAATASYQIEGAVNEDGRGESIWDVFTHTPGKIFEGQNGDVACDHYHRYREDIALMRDIGLNSYRFSISWPRIMPEGRGKINQKGLDFYDRLVDELLENGLEPFATLYHWDLPQTLQAEGGWKNRATVEAYADYAEIVAKRLGDRVKSWITLNEPWVSSVLGYITGEHAPGETDFLAGIHAAHHLLLAHGLAMPRLRQATTRRDAEFGVTLNLTYIEPGDESEEAKQTAEALDAFVNRSFLDPLFKKTYPEILLGMFELLLPLHPGDMDIIAQPLDFLGINYYFRMLPLAVEDITAWKLKTREPEGAKFTEMGWEVYPEGLYRLLTNLKKEYNPQKLYVTENGAAFKDMLVSEAGSPAVHDPDRLEYLRDHFSAALKAIQEGVPLSGYFIWSLLDNFEWAFGYSRRFGLVYTDYETQQRVLKDSGRWLRQFLHS